MRKVLAFIFFTFIFSFFTPCFAQSILSAEQATLPGYNDTIFKDRSHRKIICKVLKVDNTYAHYKLAKDTTRTYNMELWRIKYIHYGREQVKQLTPQTTPKPADSNKRDSSFTRLFGQVDVGASFPTGNLPFEKIGGHINLDGYYFLTSYLGLMGRAGLSVLRMDTVKYPLPGWYYVEQVMGGFCLRAVNQERGGGKNSVASKMWTDVFGLCGLVTAQNPPLDVYGVNSSGYPVAVGTSSSGTGYGLGFDLGIEEEYMTKKKKIFAFGLSYLFSTLHYDHYIYNLVGAAGTPYFGQSASVVQPASYRVGIIQLFIGYGFD
jgi:hypothetical protein